MPNWIKNKVILGSRTKVERIIEKYSTEEGGERYLDFNKIIPMPKDLLIDEDSWAIENWGTKWNSSNLRIDEEGEFFSFETAWEPAIPALLKLSELEPDIKFAVLYANECKGIYTGYVLFKNGKIDFEGSFEDHSIDAKKLACDCWEMSLDDLD